MKSPLAPSDLFSLIMVADPQLAFGAGYVYFRRAHLDRDADAAVSAIWRVDAEGRSVPFTAGRNDRLPRVAPDGATVAFVGERDGKPRMYLIATAGGEARTLGDAYEKIVALTWSPDSTRLAFVAATEHEPATAPHLSTMRRRVRATSGRCRSRAISTACSMERDSTCSSSTSAAARANV